VSVSAEPGSGSRGIAAGAAGGVSGVFGEVSAAVVASVEVLPRGSGRPAAGVGAAATVIVVAGAEMVWYSPLAGSK
jgi:hypothetical protein